MRAEFCRAVDRSLRGVLAGQDVPLFLAADPTLNTIYRSVNSYPHLVSFGISTPGDMSDDGCRASGARRHSWRGRHLVGRYRFHTARSVDEKSGAVTFANSEAASNYGVIDEIAKRALLTGAKVLAVCAAENHFVKRRNNSSLLHL